MIYTRQPFLKNEVEFRKTFSEAVKAKLSQDRNKLKMFGIHGECEEVRGNCMEDAMFESFMTVYPAVLANVPGIAAWATRAIYNGYKCNRDYNTCIKYK